MSSPKPFEMTLLARAESLLETAGAYGLKGHELRLQILEAVASLYGGYSLAEYHRAFRITPEKPSVWLIDKATAIQAELAILPIHPALALSALAREPLSETDRRDTGAYHTDFRLAKALAERIAKDLDAESVVGDLAVGAGILLVALALELWGDDRKSARRWISKKIVACDLSELSIRGATLSLAALAGDVRSVVSMRRRWRVADSLLMDDRDLKELAPEGLDAVIANPPWEKVKITQHEFLKSQGRAHHYGANTESANSSAFAAAKREKAAYVSRLCERFPLLRSGEPDLYAAFTELYLRHLKPGGRMALLVPGGIIRSQGTEELRRRIFSECRHVSIELFDNKARFFSIDTRFKFVALSAQKLTSGKAARDAISLVHRQGTPEGTKTAGRVDIPRAELAWTRPDLSVPEVRTPAEWAVFLRVLRAGTGWDDREWGWRAQFSREVDMTNDKEAFSTRCSSNLLPVIEGRMVQPHRFGAKAYVSGSGRKAIWEQLPFGSSRIAPQFWIGANSISDKAMERCRQVRAGFCDITGQTNERTMMAAIIPGGVVCGNKVPTVSFVDDRSEERLLAWVSVVNSFVFDWMIRRVVTTTINYFLLVSVPMPKLCRDGLPWNSIVACARRLREMDSAGTSLESLRESARLRATIDVEVAKAYGISASDMALLFEDFPLLDRGQTALPGEMASTVTRDLVLATFAEREGRPDRERARRLDDAHRQGAIGYLPSSNNPEEPDEQPHRCSA